MSTEQIINSAMSVAEDAAAGKISDANLDAALLSECRAEFATVVGEGDPLWDLQVEVARAVLRRSGIPAAELSEWAAVARRCEGSAEEPAAEEADPATPAEEDPAPAPN